MRLNDKVAQQFQIMRQSIFEKALALFPKATRRTPAERNPCTALLHGMHSSSLTKRTVPTEVSFLSKLPTFRGFS
jgi:hypothetical protein